MSEDNLKGSIFDVMQLSLYSSIFLGISLIVFGLFQDFIFYELYQIFLFLSNIGLFSGDWVFQVFEEGNALFLQIPQFLDVIWLVVALWYIGELFIHSYKMKREDYSSIISLIVVGSMVYMFFSGIYLTLSDWFWSEVVLKVIPNIQLATPIFSMYLQYAGIINLVLFFGLVIANVVDIDFSGFDTRKKREQVTNDEVL